ncbi:MAG: Serine phosphatase RsbU, regulator of sigma subunit [Candidatus Ozemobacter sibiricus]|uniref:Serine phosphatase RsbU, regulator of sigma subunit n=1 Tax=Candidatus Ozemobacter sibiricus TaxID=2268124 RepID=A0A367ZU92_9BACT|nr:MAG: Serine phosphatase RsbU, regulator of sigma subunit [Candidatus Ozemobacter sibiricus]
MGLPLLLCALSMGTQALLGLLVVARAPRQRVNQVFGLLLFLFFLWSAAEFLLIWRPFAPWLARLLFTPIILLPYVFAWFTAIFPQRWSEAPILKGGLTGLLLFAPTVLLLVLLWTDRLVATCEPIANGLLLSFGRFEFLAKGVVVGYLLLALHALSSVWHQVDSEFQMRRLRYTFAALALPGTAGPVFIALGRWYLAGYTAYTFGLFPTLGLAMSCLLAYAILRYQLMEIDLIFSIGLVYTLLSALLAGFLELMENTLQNILNVSETWSTILSTLVIAAVFSPLKDLIVGVVDRFFGKRSFDAAAVLRHLLQAMRQGSSPEEVLAALVREIAPVIDASMVVIRLRTGVTAKAGTAPEELPPLPEQWLPFDEIDAILEAAPTTPEFDATGFRAWRQAGFRLAFPLRRGETVEGGLFLGPKQGRLPYSTQEKTLVTSAVAEVIPILDNLALLSRLVARDRATQEIDWARRLYDRIQADPARSRVGGFEVLLFSSLARELKGDLIDVHDVPGDRFIAVHDAFHHGLLAALTLHLLYSALRCAPAGERLARAHAVLAPFTDPPLRSAVTYLGLGEDRLTVINAGNPPPLLFDARGDSRPVTGLGRPLGLAGGPDLSQAEVVIPAGSFLLCATNGLAKAFGDDTGDGLRRFLREHGDGGMPGAHQALQTALASLPDRAEFPDDITYVFLRPAAP